MDHAQLFDLARLQTLAILASKDTDIPAPIRSEIADAAASLARAVSMIDVTVADQITDAQRAELAAFRKHLRDNYKTGIITQTRRRFSDTGAKRAAIKRAEMQASRGR